MISPKKSLYTITGWLLVAESLLIFVPVSVLGSAINWPKSLSAPAAKMLPLLLENASAVRFGYLVYLIYSILFWLIASLTIQVLSDDEPDSIWLHVATGFGIASAVARCLGIIRCSSDTLHRSNYLYGDSRIVRKASLKENRGSLSRAQ
jgi:hypothetical protein